MVASESPATSVVKRPALRRRAGVVVAMGALLALVGCSGPLHDSSPVAKSPKGKETSSLPMSLPAVETLYSEDMVARINAERAARGTAQIAIPQLAVDPGLQATAQAWSAYLASSGTVEDPALPPCTGTGGDVCAFAANSGNTGSGFWPGDGSDGMNGDYMSSPGHRQNELGASYTNVGVGVTCADNQAWTVELFGYPATDIPSANARQATQNAVEGDPVAAAPAAVAGAPSGDPVYCPGQTYGPNGEVTTDGGQYPYPYPVPSVPGEPNGSAVVGMAATADSGGYWLARSDGTVSAHGDAVDYGSMAGANLAAPITSIVATPDGKGYWLLGSDGGIFAFGDAGFYGSMGGHPLNAPIVSLAPTADGKGYWLVGADGGIFAFGDAGFYGSMGGQALRAPVVGMAADDATGGYWLIGSDGGVFAFNAPFMGSTGSITLNRPVVGITATAGDDGYWFVASDGGLFAFGDAAFHGSAGNMTLNAPMVGMAADLSTGGYWMVGSDGGIFSDDAPFYGAD
jgi:hypothetical protein